MKHLVSTLLLLSLLFSLFIFTGCDALNTDAVQHVHSYGEWVIDTEATCISEGAKYALCDCGDKKTEAIPKLSQHVEVIDAEVPATCKATGLTNGKHCSSCNAILLEQTETPIRAHTYDDQYDGVCNICGFERDVDCAHRNKETIHGKLATCEKTGLTDGEKCLDCEDLVTEQKIISTVAHSFTNKICTVCNTYDLSMASDGLLFALNPSQTSYTVKQIIGSFSATDLIIPYEYNGLPVTAIAQSAFQNTKIVSVSIPSSVTYINDYAFANCEKLESVTIPNNVTTIGKYAFVGCSVLADLKIGDSVTTIDTSAFENCSFLGYGKTLTIPQNVSTIGSKAFKGCQYLGSIAIENGVTAIGDEAFANTFLSTVEIPNSVTSIGASAFYNCDDLRTVTLGNGVKTIGKEAFSGTWLKSIAIPDSVTEIGEKAFYNCSYFLTSVSIGKGVTYIGKDAFATCTDIATVYISDLAAWCNIWFVNQYSNPLHCGGKLYINNVLAENIEIPSTINELKEYAFYGCKSITGVTIPSSVAVIGANAFWLCSNLATVTLDEGVTTLGNYAFSNTAITSINFPASLTTLTSEPFMNCTKLANITVNENNPNFKAVDGNLYSKDGKTLVLYAKGNAATSFTVPGTVTHIANYAFCHSKNLTSVTISDGVVSIGKYAFQGCTELTEVTIGKDVQIISSYAFSYLSKLTTVTFKNTNGWWISQSETATSGTAIDVTDTTIAKKLSNSYFNYYWKRG